MPNRKVLDLSHHNDITSWSAVKGAGILGIIHKATEGSSFVDNRYALRKDAALATGLLWGAYHFANGGDVQKQVDHFLDIVGVDDTTLYALDWEDVSGNTMSAAQATEFLFEVDRRVGEHRCVVYSGNRAKEALGQRIDPFFGAHRLWLAQYGSTPVWQKSWKGYWLWQYSDGNVGPQPRGCPGVSGQVDTNSWEGTDDELRRQWSGVAAPPKIPTVNITIDPPGSVRILINGEER